MEFISTQKYVLTSPKKLREVAYVVKKLNPRDAVDRLPFSGKRAGEPLRKVIMSAVANAKVKGVSEDQLFLKEIQISEGPRLKRYRAGARGRAKPYKRRMSHIKVILTTEPATGKKMKEAKNVSAEKTETKVNEVKKEKTDMKEIKKERKIKK